MTVWTETPTLAGRHVRLRPLDPADVDALVEVARAGDLWDLFYANVSMLKTPERWLTAVVREEGSAALVATHNERLAARMDRVVRLHEGRLA